VSFNSVSGVGPVVAGISYSSNYLDLLLTVDYDPNANCSLSNPTPPATGAGTVTVKNLGSGTFQIEDAIVAHDVCQDEWYIIAPTTSVTFIDEGLSWSDFEVKVNGKKLANSSAPTSGESELGSYSWTGESKNN
jgi:hypothetical protein